MRLSVIILAAGSSSRLGQPKQLIEFRGETLIHRTIKIGLTISDDVLVVLGANSDLIQHSIQPLIGKISTVVNPDWEEGMGTSIRTGTQKLAEKSDAMMVLLCDQPLITQELLQKIVQTFANSNASIVACNYGNQLGVPMLFDKSIFPELLKLQGDKGARVFLNNFQDKITTVYFPEGLFDIDTPEDKISLQAIDI
ncbi:MAG: nucleotidyltransferase family protein [Bacteroidota bacterium]|jgi:molybdenum cofactor cytidylyltransferase